MQSNPLTEASMTVSLSESDAQAVQSQLERLLYELKKVIVGQEHLLERLLVALLVGGHVLVEGAPGLAKTLALKSLSQVLAVEFKRIQFTPDLLPADLIGTRIYNPGTGQFSTEWGPIFANFILADEINRAPAKVQSALLEAMQEHQVTIGRETYPLKSPFLVMATQNPIESQGTYPLPEAQLDRFLFKLVVQYPQRDDELVILQRMSGFSHRAPEALTPLLKGEDLGRIQQQAAAVYLDPKLMQYIVDVVQATRTADQTLLQYGASPRASLALTASSQALALMRGRTYVTCEDVKSLVHDCLRHRMILSYEALATGKQPDHILDDLLSTLPAPVLAGV